MASAHGIDNSKSQAQKDKEKNSKDKLKGYDVEATKIDIDNCTGLGDLKIQVKYLADLVEATRVYVEACCKVNISST